MRLCALVANGVTLSVPPVAAIVLLEPSDPVTVTLVAFVAVTVNVEEAPAAIDVGLAVIVTVGAVDPGPTEPQPASTRSNEKVAASGERIERKGRETRTLIMVVTFLCSGERQGLGSKLKRLAKRGDPPRRAALSRSDECFSRRSVLPAPFYFLFFLSFFFGFFSGRELEAIYFAAPFSSLTSIIYYVNSIVPAEFISCIKLIFVT